MMAVAALTGNLARENDAQRLARSQAPVKQITTGTLCHLEAAMVQNAPDGREPEHLDFSFDFYLRFFFSILLFIENVGNLVYPSSYDPGEDVRPILISVTEGEDKPLKYPSIFNSADISIVTKMDLAEAVEFDWDAACNNIQAVRPGMPVFQVSAKSGDAKEEFLGFPATRLVELRQAAVERTPAA
jgi:hydrogenase nickel incorporation protein HypB